MPDLLAIISHDPWAPVGASALDGLIATYEGLRGRPAHRESQVDGAAATCVLDGQPPRGAGIERDGRAWAAWAGSLPDTRATLARPLEELDGQFALVRRGQDQTLIVCTDPLGLKPLFTAESGGRTYVSSSALVLAKHLRLPPSRRGVESFLRSGNQMGRETPWAGIGRMLPAECIRFAPGGPTRSTYWQPAIDEEIRRLSFADCADACIERIAAEFAERYRPQRTWLDLTGGFDTRLLSVLAQRAGVDFIANTSGEADSQDVVIGRRIASEAGWPWHRFDVPPNWGERLRETVGEALAWGDCNLDALPLAEVIFGHREKSEVETGLLNGGGAEHFRDYAWGHELLRSGRSSVSYDRLMAWRVLTPIDLSVFRSDPTEVVLSDRRAELERRAEPFAGAPNTFQNDVLHAFRATEHFGAYQAIAGDYMHVDLPFYSKRVFTCSISAAPQHRSFHRLMRAMISRLDPAVASLPTKTGGPAEPVRPGNLYRFAPYPWRRSRRFLRRFGGRTPLSNAAAPPPRLAARGALVAGLRAEGRLTPTTMRSAALYRADALEEVLRRAAERPSAVDWDTVGRIVTVELSLEALDTGIE